MLKQLIAAEAEQRAAAVIPADQAVLLRGIVSGGIIQEVQQGLGIAHIHRLAGDCHFFHGIAGCVQGIYRIHVASDIQAPAGSTAGIDQQVVILAGQAAVQHLQNILGGITALALQIGANHIHQHRVILHRIAAL